jgi:hypothetical protein
LPEFRAQRPRHEIPDISAYGCPESGRGLKKIMEAFFLVEGNHARRVIFFREEKTFHEDVAEPPAISEMSGGLGRRAVVLPRETGSGG